MMNEVEAQNIELIKAEHARALQREIDEQNIRKQMASEQRRYQDAFIGDDCIVCSSRSICKLE